MPQRVQYQYFGADVDSRFIEIHCHDTGRGLKIENSPDGIARWLRSLTTPARLAVEATGSYHMELADQAHRAGVVVYVLNPRHIKSYRESVGQRAKTDPCDARLIARYLHRECDELRPFQPLSKSQRRAWQLLKRRATLVRAKDQIQQSFKGLSGFASTLKALLARLDRMIALLEKRLADQLHRDGLWDQVLRC